MRVQGLGFRVQGLGFRVQGSGFRVQGLGFVFWVKGLGLAVQKTYLLNRKAGHEPAAVKPGKLPYPPGWGMCSLNPKP